MSQRSKRRHLMGMAAAVAVLAVALSARAQSAPEADQTPQTAPDDGATTEFEETSAPPWEFETTVEVVPETLPAPSDPKLLEVNAELDRLSRGDSESVPRRERTARSPLGLESLLRALSGLCVVIALILLCTYLLKKFGNRTPLLAGSSLGTVLGKLHLSPRVSLHFVQTGGRVLVIGVTQNATSLVAEFDASAFEEDMGEEGTPKEAEEAKPRATGERGQGFLAQLKASTRNLRKEPTTPEPPAADEEPDTDIDSLRDDILRLQKYLKDNLGDK